MKDAFIKGLKSIRAEDKVKNFSIAAGAAIGNTLFIRFLRSLFKNSQHKVGEKLTGMQKLKAFLLCLTVGWTGIHCFYLGRKLSGILIVFTLISFLFITAIASSIDNQSNRLTIENFIPLPMFLVFFTLVFDCFDILIGRLKRPLTFSNSNNT